MDEPRDEHIQEEQRPREMTRLQRGYKVYVLVLLMLIYLVNQMDRFVLGVGSRGISHDLKFGEMTCHSNLSLANGSCQDECTTLRNQTKCSEHGECVWDYTGTGIEYQVLAGPAFVLVFTLSAIPMGLLASIPVIRRKYVLGVVVILWSIMTFLAGFTQSFWQLLLTRIGLGIFESACTPFASSLIGDYFDQSSMGTAMGFYNWGVYIGYSLAFAFNFIVEYFKWRWAFWVAAIPGLLMGVILMITVKEPQRKGKMSQSKNHLAVFKAAIKSYFQIPLLLLCIGGGLRNGGGLVWAYNTKAYFRVYYCNTTGVGTYLSWIPLLGGSIGAVLGGIVSDWLIRKRIQTARLWVLIGSQVLAVPFLIGVLLLPPPWAFLMLLPAYIVGEMWIGVCLVTVVELVPVGVASAAVALYLFIINNIGGNLSLLIPPLQSKIGLRNSLFLLFPGCYLLGALFFFFTFLFLCFFKKDQQRSSSRISMTIPEKQGLLSDSDEEKEEEGERENVEDPGPEESMLDWGIRIRREDHTVQHLAARRIGSMVVYSPIS